jgi:hypothetical protein
MTSFKDTTEPVTTEAGITVTTWREFSHTLKDGWRMSGSKVTASVVIPLDSDATDAGFAMDRLAGVMDRADQLLFDRGQVEAGRRNSFTAVDLEQAS